MTDLQHRIKIFVYRMRTRVPDYLLLSRDQGLESSWGPIEGPVGFGEQLETAIQREVREDVGILKPTDLIDLEMPTHWLVGDEEVIVWRYGMRIPQDLGELQLDARWRAFRWAAFSEAYPFLQLDGDRAAMVRLHTLLNAA